MTRLPSRSGPRVLLASSLAALCALSGVACSTPPSQTAQTPHQPVAVFIGDSITAGLGASEMSARWTSLLSSREGWTEVNRGMSGTGYVASWTTIPGLTCEFDPCVDFATSISDVGDLRPDVIVVSGGYNDAGMVRTDPQAVVAGISRAFAGLCQEPRDVEVIAMGPLAVNDTRDSELAFIEQAVRTAASDCGIRFLPGASDWAPQTTYPSPDGVHPGDSGYAEIARRVAESLAAGEG